MLAFRLLALAIFAAAAFSTQGKVLVYEGFHEGDWTGITATGSQQIHKATTTGNYSTGFAVGSKWSVSDSTTQLFVSGTDYGLELPVIMTAKGFTTCGGAAQTNPGAEKNELRGGVHAFTDNTLKVSSGMLYVRALMRLTTKAATRLNSVATPAVNSNGAYCGFGLVGSTSANRYPLTQTTYKSSCSFVMWKDSNASGQRVLSLCLVDANGSLTHYPLVTDFNLESTYLCYVEINVGVGADGAEFIRAGAIDTADYEGAAPWSALGGSSESIEVQLITDSYYPKAMAFAGPYGTKNATEGSFRADELVVGTELGDILPAGGIFAVSQSGAPTVGTDAFSTDWILVADQGVTATAGFVLSTDETFAAATTNSLGTGLAAGTRTASLTGLEPDTAYWWKIYADNGAETAETPVGSFKTTGAPKLGSATVTATAAAETATFSVALTEAAMENTLTTSVSVFYGTNGVDWTELPLGSALGAESFSDTVGNLGYGVTYRWFASATATMEGGCVLSDSTATNSFTTLWNGDMYVDAAAANATKPYLTPGTATKTIAAAISLAADGATIHIADGLYTITSQLPVRNAIRLVGNDGDPSRVVVSNTAAYNYNDSTHRCITVNNAGALVSGITFTHGENGANGGNVYIAANGGTVSNCIIKAGTVREHNDVSYGSNVGIVGPGLLTHCRVLGSTGNGTKNTDISSVCLRHAGARAENCLVDGFIVPSNSKGGAGLYVYLGAAVNCTVVNCRTLASSDSEKMRLFSGIRAGSGAVFTNCVSVLNTDGNGALRAIRPDQTGSFFVNCAIDGIAGEAQALSGMVSPIVGTAESFFNDYANGDYTPKADGPLVNAGANYAGMASVDLAGNPRTTGKNVDIGAYECQKTKGLLIFVR